MCTLLPTRRADHRGMWGTACHSCKALLLHSLVSAPLHFCCVHMCVSAPPASAHVLLLSIARFLSWSCVHRFPHLPLLALCLQNRVSSERLHVVGEAYATSLMAPLAMLVSRHRVRLQAVAPPPAYLPVGAPEADYEALDASPVVAAVKSGLRYFLCTLAR